MKYYDIYFAKLSFGELVESFIFSLMSKSINYRKIAVNIIQYEAYKNYPGIVKESINLFWSSFWFENLYLTDGGYYAP